MFTLVTCVCSWSCQVKNMLQGPLTVDVGEVLTDPALNVNLPAPQLVIVYDTVPPVPVIWSDTPSPTLHNVIMEGTHHARCRAHRMPRYNSVGLPLTSLSWVTVPMVWCDVV